MKNYDYVIFDFDGTVVDTGEGILKSLQYAFEKQGREIPDLSDLRRFIGPPIHYSFVTYYDVSEDKVQDYIKSYRERYRAVGIYECEIYDGILDVLGRLREGGIKIGIASSKPLSLIYDVMNYLKITDCFDAVVGTRFDDSNHPNKTDLVLQSMSELGATDKSRVLMVGDRCYDIDGASGAGVDSCGVIYGYGNKEEFMQHNATHIADTAEDILKIVF